MILAMSQKKILTSVHKKKTISVNNYLNSESNNIEIRITFVELVYY
jgi:hypothetical protein